MLASLLPCCETASRNQSHSTHDETGCKHWQSPGRETARKNQSRGHVTRPRANASLTAVRLRVTLHASWSHGRVETHARAQSHGRKTDDACITWSHGRDVETHTCVRALLRPP